MTKSLIVHSLLWSLLATRGIFIGKNMSNIHLFKSLSNVPKILDEYMFGYDVFISYAWKDGRKYAEALAAELQNKKYRCFLDSSEYKVGDDLNRDALRAMKWSRALAIVITKSALASKHVRKEINLFEAAEKPIVPIDIDDALYNQTITEDGTSTYKLSDSYNSLLEKANQTERTEIEKTFYLISRDAKLQIKESIPDSPSDSTIAMLYDRFNFARKISRRLRIISATCMLLVVLTILALFALYEAAHQRNQAERNLAEAIRTAKTITEDVDSKLEDVPGAEQVREKLLGAAYSMLADLLKQTPGNADVEIVQADTAQNLGVWNFKNGLVDVARTKFEEAHNVYTKIPGYETKVIRSLLNLGRTNRELRFHSLAQSNYEKVLLLTNSLELRSEAARFKAEALYGLGDILYDTAHLEDALHKHLEAENLRRLIINLAPAPTVNNIYLESLLDLGTSTDRIAHIYDQLGDLANAMRYHEESYRISNQLLLFQPGSGQYRRDFALAASRLGYDYQRTQNLEKALQYYQEGELQLRRLVEIAPGSKQFRYDWAIALTDLGNIFTTTRDFKIADKNYKDSLTELDKVIALDPENPTFIGQKIVTLNDFAEMYRASNNAKEALKWYLSALSLTEKKISQWPNIPNQNYTKIIILLNIFELVRVDSPRESNDYLDLAFKENTHMMNKYPDNPLFKKTMEKILQFKNSL